MVAKGNFKGRTPFPLVKKTRGEGQADVRQSLLDGTAVNLRTKLTERREEDQDKGLSALSVPVPHLSLQTTCNQDGSPTPPGYGLCNS